MDELELLKKDWKENKSDDFKNYTEKELFAMTKKRSVSIAKWVFIIALLELGFWFLIGYLMPSSSSEDKYQDIPFVNGILSVKQHPTYKGNIVCFRRVCYLFTICFYWLTFVFKF